MDKLVQKILSSFNKVLFRYALFSVLLVTIVFMLTKNFAATGAWTVGCLWGFCDIFLLFRGVRRGMRESPEASIAEMHRTLLQRLSFAIIAVVVVLKVGLGLFGVFMGFILSHVFLLINLVIITNRS